MTVGAGIAFGCFWLAWAAVAIGFFHYVTKEEIEIARINAELFGVEKDDEA